MDPFDEFEFKPLTDGLGFHKKTASLKEQVKDSGLLDEHLQELPTSAPRMEEDLVPKKPMSFDDVIGSLEKAPFKPSMPGKSFLEITEPLPRTRETIKTMDVELPPMPSLSRAPVQSPFPSQELFRQPIPHPSPAQVAPKPAAKKELANTGTRRGAADSPHGQLILTSVSIPSAVLDFVFVIAMSLIFMAGMLTITKMDLATVVHAAQTDVWAMASLIVAFIAIMQMYVIVARSFYGRTLGEWTFDVQLGRDEDQTEAYYPFKVIGRSLLITVTGLVLLPLLSLIARRDLAGRIVGVQLYQQRM